MTFGSFLTFSIVPSDRIWPWCSTVTLWAMSSTNFMSCSITSTERFLMMRLSSSAVLERSLTLMPATGSSSISSSGSWISSMPISSHCFWPWLSRAALMLRRSFRKIISATSCTRSRTTASRVKVSAPNTVRPRGNEISRFSNTVRSS